jgi:hypothetical protein
MCPHLYNKSHADEELNKAMKYYRLEEHELMTLPHVTFENVNRPGKPGRSYVDAELEKLAYRKLATLNGVAPLPEAAFLQQGRQLFDDKYVNS